MTVTEWCAATTLPSKLSTVVDATRQHRKRTTKEHSLEKKYGEDNVDSSIQVQLEEDGGGSTECSGRWRIGGLWPVFHPE